MAKVYVITRFCPFDRVDTYLCPGMVWRQDQTKAFRFPTIYLADKQITNGNYDGAQARTIELEREFIVYRYAGINRLEYLCVDGQWRQDRNRAERFPTESLAMQNANNGNHDRLEMVSPIDELQPVPPGFVVRNPMGSFMHYLVTHDGGEIRWTIQPDEGTRFDSAREAGIVVKIVNQLGWFDKSDQPEIVTAPKRAGQTG